MNKFGLYTKFTAHEGRRDELAGMLLEAAQGMASVESCDVYAINIPDEDSTGVWVTEVWSDSSAHQASLSLEEAKSLIQKARPLIAGIEQIKLTTLGGKGIYRLKKGNPMVSIREIREEDAERHLALCRKLDHETKFMLYEPGERSTSLEHHRKFIQSFIASDNSTILIAEHDDQFVGYLLVDGGKAKRIKHVGYIVVGILAAYQGQGIGTRLFQALEEWRENTELKRLELTVMSHNETAVSLYKKMGFEIEGTKKKSLYIDGRYIDEFYMGKTFE